MIEKIVEKHQIGDTAIVKEYTIFNPAPSSWNGSVLGDGRVFTPKENFVVSSDIDIYGQYKNPTVYYYFFEDDPKISYKTDKWEVRFGQSIQIPKYEYTGFKCWMINDKPYFENQYITVLQDIHMLPSCCYEYKVHFEPNGGYGRMDNINCQSSKYIKLQCGKPVTRYEDQKVALPPNRFRNTEQFEFKCWQVDGVMRNVGDVITVNSNKISYAIWNKKKGYTIESETYSSYYKDGRDPKYDTKVGHVQVIGGEYDRTKTLNAIVDDPTAQFLFWRGISTSQSKSITVDCNEGKNYISAFFQLSSNYFVNVTVNEPSYGYVEQHDTQLYNVKRMTAYVRDQRFYEFSCWILEDGSISSENPIDIKFKDKLIIDLSAIFSIGKRHTTVYTTTKTIFVEPKDRLTYFDVENTAEYNYSIKAADIGTAFETIGRECFSRCYSMISVLNGTNINLYEKESFKGSSIVFIDFGKNGNNLSILDNAFENCYKLDHVDITENIVNVGYQSFYLCKGISSLTISTDLESQYIGTRAFEKCTKLKSVVFKRQCGANGKLSLGDDVFLEDYNLTTVDMTDIENIADIPSISYSTFGEPRVYSDRVFKFKDQMITTGLSFKKNWKQYRDQMDPPPLMYQSTIINIMSDTKSSSVILCLVAFCDGTIDWGDGNVDVIYIRKRKKNNDGEIITLRHKYNQSGEFTIEFTDCISKFISISCKDLDIVDVEQFGQSLTTIGEYAFRGTGIQRIKIQPNTETVEHDIFENCENIQFNESSIQIDNGSLFGNSWIIIDRTYKTISRLKNRGLDTRIEIPDGVTVIKKMAFGMDINNLTSVYIPSTVIGIEPMAFYGMRYDLDIRIDVENRDYIARNGMIMTKDGFGLVAGYVQGVQSTPSIHKILPYAFAGTQDDHVQIPSNVVSIGYGAFSYMKNLKTIDFSQNEYYYSIEYIKSSLVKDKWCLYSVRDGDILNEITVKKGSDQFKVIVTEYGQQEIVDEEQKNIVKAVIVAIDDWSENGQYSGYDGVSSDADKYSGLFGVNSIGTEVFKNQRATAQAVIDKISQITHETQCKNVFIVICGCAKIENGKNYICLYDRNVQDSEIWNVLKNSSCSITMIFSCCHTESSQAIDFSKSIKQYFGSITNKPKILFWNSCSDNQPSWWVSNDDKEEKNKWYKKIQQVGTCFTDQITKCVTEKPYEDFQTNWESLSSGYFSTINRTHVDYSSYEEFKEKTPQSKWYRWNGPTPNNAVVGNFDQTRIMMYPNLYKLNIEDGNFDIIVSKQEYKNIYGQPYYRSGEKLTVEIQPYMGTQFVSWSDGIKTNPRGFTMNQDYELSINTLEIVQYSLNIIENETAYSITYNPDSENHIYNEGTTVRVTVNMKSGYGFEKWDDGNHDNPRTFVMTSDYDLDVIFYSK